MEEPVLNKEKKLSDYWQARAVFYFLIIEVVAVVFFVATYLFIAGTFLFIPPIALFSVWLARRGEKNDESQKSSRSGLLWLSFLTFLLMLCITLFLPIAQSG